VAINRTISSRKNSVNNSLLRCAISLSSYQRGQAMPLGIALILVGVVGAFVLFNTGQVAVNKQRLSDAADSAAYSGVVWQARALNFQAYTNRAMIANDVSIGQAVSLASWSTYTVIATENIATVTAPFPPLAAITRPLANIFQSINRIVNRVIGGSQDAMFGSAFIATPDIVDKVAKASDSRFETISGYSAAGLYDNLTMKILTP